MAVLTVFTEIRSAPLREHSTQVWKSVYTLHQMWILVGFEVPYSGQETPFGKNMWQWRWTTRAGER